MKLVISITVGNMVAPNDTVTLNADEVAVYTRNRTIVVEEVDRNGNSVIKAWELPDYEDSKEVREDERQKEQRDKVYLNELEVNDIEEDIYGCSKSSENQRRKCLKRQKKLLRKRYKDWKNLIRRIIKDIDRKINSLRKECLEEPTRNDLNKTSELSPGCVTRQKD